MSDSRELVEKRLAKLILRPLRDIQFAGNPTEVAYQVCHTVSVLKDALETVGLRGIDYERMAEIKGTGSTGTPLPDAMYASHVRDLRDLEHVLRDAFSDTDDEDIVLWSWCRLDMYKDENGYRSHSYREAARRYREMYGHTISKKQVERRCKELDHRLDTALHKQGWTL